MGVTVVEVGATAVCVGAILGWVVRGRAAGRAGTESSQVVVDLVPLGAVVVDGSDDVLMANAAARGMGLIRGKRLAVTRLRELAAETRRSGERQQAEISLLRGRLVREPAAVVARAAPARHPGHVALLVEDVTEFRRVEAVRHDFVANVSHELKTPIGALSLLAEAVGAASDSPEDVRRFAGRMRQESSRLGQLVQELIELSRLQGGDPLPAPNAVPVDAVIAEAVDATRLLAMTRTISVATTGARDLTVLGVKAQLVTAVANLLDNAIRYSGEGSEVSIDVQPRDGLVDVVVRDRGIGIAAVDIERVFERFYRADAARSRATGGTGLGLAIVKHIATNHGGGVDVTSIEGAGAAFTLHLPALDAPAVRRVRRSAHRRAAVRP